MIGNTSFKEKLTFGKVGEGQIAQWLQRARGYDVLPVYEIEIPTGKGPRLFSLPENLIAPDMLAMKCCNGIPDIRWIEAKHKTRFSWHRNSQNWQTGIDLRHYLDYIKVQMKTQLPVWLLFLHDRNVPSSNDIKNGCPKECPVGLFGAPITYLVEREHHRDRYERGYREYPMVYWNRNSFKLLATIEEVHRACEIEEQLEV